MRFVSLCLSLTALLAGARPCLAADFTTEAKLWADQYSERFEEATKLSNEGYASAGNEILIALAEQDGGPFAAFTVANTLFRLDPAASYRLHQRVQEALPNDPTVALEMAKEQHRRGEFAAAIVNYRRRLETGAAGHISALLADCLIRTGDLKGAVAAWNQADHAKNRDAIDFAICTIYGPLMPTQRRGDLITKIEAGDLTKLTDLILLDLTFDSDWWNAPVYEEGLERDLKLASQLLGRKDARYQALAVYAKLARAKEKKSSETEKALKDANFLIGPGAELPSDSQLARALCELAVGAKAVTPAELWTAYEAVLRARVQSEDHNALRLLCWLAAANRNPELTDFDRLGWEEWNDPVFAPGYMVDLYREKKLTGPDDSQLMAAMAVAKDNANLNNLRIALAGDDVTNDMIAGAIKAEYRKLSMGETRRDSARLKVLFDELGKRL